MSPILSASQWAAMRGDHHDLMDMQPSLVLDGTGPAFTTDYRTGDRVPDPSTLHRLTYVVANPAVCDTAVRRFTARNRKGC